MRRIKKVVVIGAGIMGHSLAQLFASGRCDVSLVDHKGENLRWAKGQIRRNLDLLSAERLLSDTVETIIDRIRFTLDLVEGVEGSEFVLETVSENMDVKGEVFRNLDVKAPAQAILATNTSGLSVTKISEFTTRPEKVVGCHWWNPPHLMPLVEVINGAYTSSQTLEATCEFVRSLGKDPIIIQKDIPGFVWNRLQIALLREALYLLEQGVASLDDIEKAVKKGYALRSVVLGPFETIDVAGVRLWKSVSSYLNPVLCNDPAPSPIFDIKLRAGELGVEAGRGFHDYSGRTHEEVLADRDRRLINVIKKLGYWRPIGSQNFP